MNDFTCKSHLAERKKKMDLETELLEQILSLEPILTDSFSFSATVKWYMDSVQVLNKFYHSMDSLQRFQEVEEQLYTTHADE